MQPLQDDIKILVLCTGNSCRSQMAEGFLREQLKELGLKKSAAAVRSAGIETHGVNPKAIATMAEIGIDISKHTSNNVQEYINDKFDYVITVCDNAAENCPHFPALVKLVHLPFDDPAKATGSDEQVMKVFAEVRDKIKTEISSFLNSILDKD